MKILNISFDEKSNHFRVETEIDTFFVDYEDYEEYQLSKDKEINKDLLSKLHEKEILNKAYLDGMNFLSYRIRTKKEIVKKLNTKYTPSVIDATILRLEKEGYIDDSYFIKQYTNSKLGNNHWSIKKIEFELRNLGIESQILNIFFQENDFSTIEEENIRYFYRKNIKKWQKKYEDSYKLKNKAIQFLLSKGFNYNSIVRVVGESFE